jgi:hypothetical protein
MLGKHFEGMGGGVGFIDFANAIEGGAIHEADIALVINDQD